MTRHPLPVPPIFQPEVAARAVRWAAQHDRRELYVGGSTVYTIWGAKLAPWLAERYLARTGYDAQQMEDLPLEPGRPDNVFEPSPGDAGAHGRFDEQAHERSELAWLSRQRRWLGVGGTLAAAGLAALSLRRG